MSDLVVNSAWREAAEDWFCPACGRNKHQVIRTTSTGSRQGKLVVHHDHYSDHCAAVIMDAYDGLVGAEGTVLLATARHLIAYLEAFDRVLICEGCNHAEGNAKQIVGAPARFSFGPVMLRRMRSVDAASGVDEPKARRLWLRAMIGLEVRDRKLKLFLLDQGRSWREPTPTSDAPVRWRELFDALDETPGWQLPRTLLLSRKAGK